MKKILVVTIIIMLTFGYLSPSFVNASSNSESNFLPLDPQNSPRTFNYDMENYDINILEDNEEERLVRVTDKTTGEVSESRYNKEDNEVRTSLIKANGESEEIFNINLTDEEKAIESIKVQSASSSLLAHSSGSRFNNYFEYYYYSGNTWFLKVDSSGKTAIENTKNGKNILGFRDSVNSLRSAEIKWLDFAGASATSWVVAIITAPTGFGLAVGTLTAVGLAFLANSYAEDMKAYADDCRFYFLRVLSGWIEDGKYTWYYYDIYGNKTIGWKNIMSKWYYFNSSGVMQFGWLLDGGKWYYLDYLTGAMKTGWLLDGGNWYYLNSPSGNMSNSGWQLIGGKYYYFYSNGVMAVNTTIGGYRVGSDGAWIP